MGKGKEKKCGLQGDDMSDWRCRAGEEVSKWNLVTHIKRSLHASPVVMSSNK